MSSFGAERARTARVAPSNNAGFTPRECERIYRNMVLGELRNGPLSAVRQARLLHYAAKLRLSQAEAAQLMDEAKQEYARRAGSQSPTRLPRPGRSTSASGLRILLGLALATVIVLVQLMWRLATGSR